MPSARPSPPDDPATASTRGRGPFLRYGAALLLAAAAVLITLPLKDFLAPSVFLFFFPAVLVSAWFGGLGPALVTGVVSALVVQAALTPRPIMPRLGDGADVLRLAVFVGFSLLAGYLTSSLRRARARAEAAAAAERASAREAERSRALAERERRRTAFLSEASRILTSSLDYDTTLRRIASLAVPEHADWCVVDMAGVGGALRRVAIAHADVQLDRLAQELVEPPAEATASPEENPMARAFRSGEPLLLTRVDPWTLALAPRGSEQARLVERLGASSVLAAPLPGASGPIGVLSLVTSGGDAPFDSDDVPFAMDLAGRAALAVQNARLYATARRAVDARDELMAAVSHDLRSPLNNIGVAAALLDAPDLAPERRRRQPGVIRAAVRQMDRMLSDLLDISRFEAGQLTLRLGPIEPGPLLRDGAHGVGPVAEASGVTIEVADAAGLPRLWGDRERLLQVLTNLLANAVRYSPGGSAVELGAAREEGAVRITVRDHGPGIPSDEVGRVFDRFWQSERGVGGGAGLGLSIAKSLVEAHGGRIWVDTTPREGCALHFTIPVAGAGGSPVGR